MLYAQDAYLLGVRDARAESVRFSKDKQFSASTTQIHPSNHSTSSNRSSQTEGKLHFCV